MMTADPASARDWPTLFHDTLMESMTDVFGSPTVERARFGIRTEEETVALLGFYGEAIKGHLGVAASADFFAKWHPVPDLLRGAGEIERNDWLGELANRLVGRIRSRWGVHGIEIEVSTPTILRSTSVTVRPKADRWVSTYETRVAPIAYVWTQLELDSRHAVPTRPTVRHAEPGEIIRF